MSFHRNIKNQKLYKVVDSIVINATNGREDEIMVLYKDKDGRKFVREKEEFAIKFEKSDAKNYFD